MKWMVKDQLGHGGVGGPHDGAYKRGLMVGAQLAWRWWRLAGLSADRSARFLLVRVHYRLGGGGGGEGRRIERWIDGFAPWGRRRTFRRFSRDEPCFVM